MSRIAAILLAAFFTGCAAAPDRPAPAPAMGVALKNADFETLPHPQRPCALGWDCSMHNDPQSFRFFHDEAKPYRGKRSMCAEPVKNEPWALVSQAMFDIAKLRGERVRFTVAVRLEGVTGDGAGAFVLAQGGGGAVIAHDKKLVQGTRGWERIGVEITVPPAASLIEMGVALEGRGRVCLDDAVLEVLGSSKSPV
jgi:hypothetical protein